METPPPSIQQKITEHVRPPEDLTNIATAYGNFYNALIDTGLTPQTDFAQKAEQLIPNLPDSLQGIAKQQAQAITDGLTKNHALLKEHEGQEIPFILRLVMTKEGLEKSVIEEALEKAKQEGTMWYEEPTPGVPILHARHDFYDYLVTIGVLPDSSAMLAQYQDKTIPKFMVVKRWQYQEAQELEKEAVENKSIRHETHHLYWNFLREKKLIPNNTEKDPQTQAGCNLFRNELMAYVITRTLRYEDIEHFVYTDDSTIQQRAQAVRRIAEMGVAQAVRHNTSPFKYLYAAIQGRSFDEIEALITQLTPHGNQLKALDAMYRFWTQSFPPSLLGFKGEKPTISKDALGDYLYYNLESVRFFSLAQLKIRFTQIEQFGRKNRISTAGLAQAYQDVLAIRLPLPKETVDLLTSLPISSLIDVPLGYNPDIFLAAFITIDNIHYKPIRDLYSQVINSSPVMREVFNRRLEELIQREKKTVLESGEYTQASNTKKEQMNKQLERRLGFLRKL